MLPLRDLNPTRGFPFVTVALIAANVIVFIVQLLGPSVETMEGLIGVYGLVPRDLTTGADLSDMLTLLTSMFLHGGLIHVGSNMLFLWIFGNNVEDLMGSVPFLGFYLVCGVIAGLSQVLVNPDSTVPIVGASGAIAGVLASYVLLFPTAKVEGLIFLGFFIRLIRLPAVVYLGAWIALQFLSGLASFGVEEAGGTAWFAHIGGFLSGLVLTLPLRLTRGGKR